ncbi:hypothetical protein FAM21823_02355 [Lentilactobacillus parabuchneri]|nr:hypothetical protein FAM21823_02355 [Lentilactobacillus parabuchneri]
MLKKTSWVKKIAMVVKVKPTILARLTMLVKRITKTQIASAKKKKAGL